MVLIPVACSLLGGLGGYAGVYMTAKGNIAVAEIEAQAAAALARQQLTADMKAELATSDVDQAKIFLDRIDRLEHRLDDQAQKLAELAIENTRLLGDKERLEIKVALLESQDKYGPESRTAAVFDLFSEWQTSAWCKRMVSDAGKPKTPVMAYVNPWFEVSYGISSESFVGSTDFDHFDEAQAQEYTDSDMRTYRSKGWEDFIAPRPTPGGQPGPPVRFKKLYHDVKGGPELICGWEVNQ